jgi:hypothetical protein
MTLRDDVERLATGLARSGRHIDCLTIESQLAHEGHAEVYVVLQDAALRARLKAICDEHWQPGSK